jgi:hypothetical protein
VAAFLLDANVLIALAWPAHVSHTVAHRWFDKHAQKGWATCPLTECAFVRVISNPAFSSDALTPQAAIDLLAANRKHPAHIFWPDNIDLAQAVRQVDRRLTGHQQITDAYLLGLAIHHKGKLATLDHALGSLIDKSKDAVELVS